MLKFFYELIIHPLGLPIEPLYEYILLLIVGVLVHKIAFDISPGGTFGSLIYWGSKLIVFITIWAVLYAVIASIQFVLAHWIWFALGVVTIICILMLTHRLNEK